MVKLGEDYKEDKNAPKKRNHFKDFGEFLENYWWGLLIFGWIVFGGVEGIIKAGRPEVPVQKEMAVVIQVEDGYEDYKVKYLSDGAVQVIDLGDDGYVVGDTVLAER